MFEELTSYLDSFLKMGIPYYDCLIKIHGNEVFRRTNGFINPEKKIPVTGKEFTNFYSCSKQITCTAALQLWEKGLFSLEDKVSDYIPEYSKLTVQTEEGIKKCDTPLQVKHLFEMSSGYGYSTMPHLHDTALKINDGKPTTLDAVRLLAQEPLEFSPGQMWRYGPSHDILAALVEVISGERFGRYVKKHIFDICGMTKSTFYPHEVNQSEIAQQYAFDTNTQKAVPIGPELSSLFNLGPYYESGGAGLRSTVEEYSSFLEHLRSGEDLLKRSTIALQITNRYTDRDYPRGHGRYGYGLGCRCPLPGNPLRAFGWGGKAGQFFAVDLEHDLTIVYSQHVVSPPNGSLKGKIYDTVLRELEKINI